MPQLTFSTHSLREPGTSRPVVLCIGGSDSAGLAGIQADSRACEAMGVHAATAITAVTAQNNDGLYSLNPVDAQTLEAQIDAALTLQPAVIKIGLLGCAAQIDMLARKLHELDLPVVLDTVLATSSEGQVLDSQARAALLQQLAPLATVLTPNLPESGHLLAREVNSATDIEAAATALREHGARWVVIKGGHGNSATLDDYCQGPDHSFTLSQPRIDSDNLRGTGCTLAALIASAIALGYEVRDALVIARMGLQEAIINSKAVNDQKGCTRPQTFPRAHWPQYQSTALPLPKDGAFPPCTGDEQPDTLGLYPIVDRADWLERLLPLGVTTIQLRNKDLQGEALAAEVERAVGIARKYSARLFINDHWQLAIAKGAYGVHLGQEDLATADLQAIREAGLRLGISNHCHYEVMRAQAVQPSYIATGPVFATATKDMPWIPHGLMGLEYWCESLPNYPLVAIAGIDADNIGQIAATGVSGIALITAITLADDPEAMTKTLVRSIEISEGIARGESAAQEGRSLNHNNAKATMKKWLS